MDDIDKCMSLSSSGNAPDKGQENGGIDKYQKSAFNICITHYLSVLECCIPWEVSAADANLVRGMLRIWMALGNSSTHCASSEKIS